MSVIEYATKIQTTLGAWTGMNIEVVSKRGGKVEFFSLPYEVIQLLADRRIASLLSQIGEFSMLNLVLAQDFSRLLELGYRLLRIGLKPHEEWGKSERDFVNQTLRLDKNRENPARVADQIFQLYALLEEKRKRREPYEQYRIF
jgi:CRISPR-associated protein Cst1